MSPQAAVREGIQVGPKALESETELIVQGDLKEPLHTSV